MLNKQTYQKPEVKTKDKKIYTQEEVAEICKIRLQLLKESSNDYIDNSIDFLKNLRKE